MENFVLAAVASLPTETRKFCSKILVRPYVLLHRPRCLLAQVAACSPDYTVAARWLGRHFAIAEWTDIAWSSNGCLSSYLKAMDPDTCHIAQSATFLVLGIAHRTACSWYSRSCS